MIAAVEHRRLDTVRAGDPLGHFGRSVRHGVLIKQYVNPDVGRYAPPALMKAERININGIRDLATICTSHVERNNLTIRTFMKRFTRLGVGLLKEAGEPCSGDRDSRCRLQLLPDSRLVEMHPGDGCGRDRQLWSMDDLYDAVTDRAERKRKAAQIERLIAQLQAGNNKLMQKKPANWLLPALAILGPAFGMRVGMWCWPQRLGTGGAIGFAVAALVLYAIESSETFGVVAFELFQTVPLPPITAPQESQIPTVH